MDGKSNMILFTRPFHNNVFVDEFYGRAHRAHHIQWNTKKKKNNSFYPLIHHRRISICVWHNLKLGRIQTIHLYGFVVNDILSQYITICHSVRKSIQLYILFRGVFHCDKLVFCLPFGVKIKLIHAVRMKCICLYLYIKSITTILSLHTHSSPL